MKTAIRVLQASSTFVLTLILVGCSTIVHSGNRPVIIHSNPTGATVKVTNTKGEIVTTQTTPFTAKLDPHRGYFKGEKYTATFELPGYVSSQVPINPHISGWYFGNLVFGGLIGFVIVDPLTGAMWNMRPLQIDQTLEKSPVSPVPPPSEIIPNPASVPAHESEGTNSTVKPSLDSSSSP